MINYTNRLLDRVKAKFELTSDYQLAKKLDIRPGRVSNWRKGVSSMEWEIAFRIADLLQEADQNVVYGLLDDKEKNPRVINALHQGRAH